MRIGVVSDTHDNLRNVARIVELLSASGVHRVVHTGDVTKGRTLAALAEVPVPIFGVLGNNDERDDLYAVAAEHGVRLSDDPLELEWGGRRIAVVHDPRDWVGPCERFDVLLHGHTHRRVIERDDGRLVFNPGECAGTLAGRNTIGVVDLSDLAVELLRF